MLKHRLGPRTDPLGLFLRLLEALKDFRLDAKRRMQETPAGTERLHLEALQSVFKVLINSFYGYLGFSQARFSDFDAAEKVTELGRTLLASMIAWLRSRGAAPVEIDTDGIYFVPPPGAQAGAARGSPEGTGGEEQPALEAFRRQFAASLPEGIEIEFDGIYEAMYSYKMKNYALLCRDGRILIKGAALKSRGVEPFQRQFLEELIRLKLEGRDGELPQLKERYERAIRDREWPIKRLAKTEMLQDAPATYAAKVSKGRRGRSALYELALASRREYRPGDQISYYVTGVRSGVAVHESVKPVSLWNPANRDENIAHYLAKLDALWRRFALEPATDNDAQPDLNI
jgi:DNA polymerase elongation subunit (family B)